MSTASLGSDLDLADVNFRLATGAFFATSRLGEVVETHDTYITNTGAPVGDFNVIFPKRPSHKVERAIDKGARYFESCGFPYRVIVRSDLAGGCREILEPRGFTETKPVPGMLLAPLPEAPALPDGLEVRRVADADTLADFQQTSFAGFGLPIEAAEIFLTQDFLELPNVALLVGYAGGEPASTAALVATTGVAGIYWVATLEPFRGRGFGEALTWQAVAAGRELGYPLASLQASEMGRPVYARMGFDHDRDYAQFDSPRSDSPIP